MGSEMCIRDRPRPRARAVASRDVLSAFMDSLLVNVRIGGLGGACLLYTSDAADERSSVDLGGRRIIKKKKRKEL